MQYILYIKSLLYKIHVHFLSIWYKESSLTSVIFCQVCTNLVPMDLASKYQLLLFLKKKIFSGLFSTNLVSLSYSFTKFHSNIKTKKYTVIKIIIKSFVKLTYIRVDGKQNIIEPYLR